MGKMPEVCISLYSHSVQEIIREAGRAAVALADSVEVRFDQLWLIPRSARETNEDGEEAALEERVRPLDDVNVDEAIQAVVEGIELPILFTCAPSAAPDGRFPGTMDDRVKILEQAISNNVTRIDIDTHLDKKATKRLMEAAAEAGVGVVRSDISEEEAPPTEDIVQRITDLGEGAELVRFVRQCESNIHGLRLVEAGWVLSQQKDPPQRSIGGLGRSGDWPRIHAPLHGDHTVFAILTEGSRIQSTGLVNARDIRIAWEVLEYPND